MIRSSSLLFVNDYVQPSYASSDTSNSYRNFVYSADWVGTSLRTLTLKEAAEVPSNDFKMGKWPDPILRETAHRINYNLMGSDALKAVAVKLRRTARKNRAVGLAAQQW